MSGVRMFLLASAFAAMLAACGASAAPVQQQTGPTSAPPESPAAAPTAAPAASPTAAPTDDYGY